MTSGLRALDWSIVIAYLVAIIGVGFAFSRRNKSADAYFKGGGRLPWWVTAFSIYAATFSPLTFLAIPALVYATDMSYYPIFFGAVIATGVAVKWFLPFFISPSHMLFFPSTNINLLFAPILKPLMVVSLSSSFFISSMHSLTASFTRNLR